MELIFILNITNTLKLIFQATPTYSLISNNGNNGYCRHADGGLLSTCAGASSISSIGRCATFCSRKSNCPGFIYASSNGACQLYTSDSTCPTGFRYISRQATAETIFELVAIPSSTWVCYGKKSGNLITYHKEYNDVFVILYNTLSYETYNSIMVFILHKKEISSVDKYKHIVNYVMTHPLNLALSDFQCYWTIYLF